MRWNPLRQIVDVRREEWPTALLMSSYFFLVITSFWILKPLKKSLFIGFYDAHGFAVLGATLTGPQAELLAKVLNMVVAAVAVPVFSAVSLRIKRQQLTFAFCGFFIAAYALYAVLLRAPGAPAVWSFYLFGDLFSTLMVAAFFAFLNDSVTPDSAKRLYGVVGLGGVLGGVFGAGSLRAFIAVLDTPEWMWVTAVLAGLIVLIAAAAGRHFERAERARPIPERSYAREGPGAAREPAPETSAFAGVRLVLRSRYLLCIVGIVGIYEILSTILDFQFTATVAHYLDGPAITAHLASTYAVTNAVALAVQLLLTSFVMRRFGVGVALLVLPVAVLAASASFLALPVLLVGTALNTADSGFSYSINQSAKEALYVPTSRDEKYLAKAFIDIFVQRAAKALAVGVSLAVTLSFRDFESVRWLSLATLPLLGVWIAAARHAGQRFDLLSAGSSASRGGTQGGILRETGERTPTPKRVRGSTA